MQADLLKQPYQFPQATMNVAYKNREASITLTESHPRLVSN